MSMSFAPDLAAPRSPLVWAGQGIAADTPVATPSGPVAAGRLRPGDRVLDAAGRAVAVTGVHRVGLAAGTFRRLGLPAPVLVAPGVLGFGRPAAALLLGPAQTLRLAGAWITADLLVDGRGIVQADQAITAVELALPAATAFLAAGVPLGPAGTRATTGADDRIAAALLRQAAAFGGGGGEGGGGGGGGGGGALQGHLDHADRFGMVGWARYADLPLAVVPLEIAAEGRVIAHAIADRPRPDLVTDGEAGATSVVARHGFTLRFATPLPAGRAWLMQVRRAGGGMELPGSPLLIDTAGSTVEDFETALAGVGADAEALLLLARLTNGAQPA